MKRKKIRYVFLEAAAFLSDPVFLKMNAAQRGVYCTLIFYLYQNDGQFPYEPELLKKICNCNSQKDFSKIWRIVKQKFVIKNKKIKHKRVTKELKAARKKSQLLSEAGVKGNDKRWKNNRHPIATQSLIEAKRSESKRIEQKRIEANTRLSNNDSPFKSLGSTPRPDSPDNLHLNIINFYDRLTSIFTSRTVSDTKSLRNLSRWVMDNIFAGKFNNEIVPRILEMAADSKNGRSRKPIAVFFAQVKKDLAYKQ